MYIHIPFNDNHIMLNNSLQVHALETGSIKPDPFNQYVSAAVVSGIATVSIGNIDIIPPSSSTSYSCFRNGARVLCYIVAAA